MCLSAGCGWLWGLRLEVMLIARLIIRLPMITLVPRVNLKPSMPLVRAFEFQMFPADCFESRDDVTCRGLVFRKVTSHRISLLEGGWLFFGGGGCGLGDVCGLERCDKLNV